MTGAPGSTQDAKLLCHKTLISQIESDEVIPRKTIKVGGAGERSLVTVGVSAFPC